MIMYKWRKDDLYNLFLIYKSNNKKDDCILFVLIMMQIFIILMETKLYN